ncbi:MAG: hypothetical protein MUF13_05780 [Akkermansiaceae bacterium]|jgi:hypothetical protein|nr:hypothetical protein [Akkermansiaceae bacterium]
MIRAILFGLLLVPLAAQTVPKPLFIDPHYHGSCDPEAVWNPERGEASITDGQLVCDRDAPVKP